MKHISVGSVLLACLLVIAIVTPVLGESGTPVSLAQAVTVDVTQEIPVEITLLVPIDGGEPISVTTPLTLNLAIRVTISGDQMLSLHVSDAATTGVAKPTASEALSAILTQRTPASLTVDEYREATSNLAVNFAMKLTALSMLTSNPTVDDDDWWSDVRAISDSMSAELASLESLNPPTNYGNIHGKLVEGVSLCTQAANVLADATNNSIEASILQAAELMESCNLSLDEATAMLDAVNGNASSSCRTQVLKGSGDEVVKVEHLAACTVATLTHTGDENFIVIPYDTNNERISSLVNEVGPYRGTVKWHSAIDTLEIKADGDWTITVR